MWKRVLRIWQFARFIDKANRLLPGHEKHTIRVHSSRDPDGLLRKTSPHLSFTPEEEENGRRGLAALGVDPKFPIACIYGRDSAYLNAVSPGNNWAYHDYRDTKISNFIPAALDLVHRGYHVLRVGHFVKEKFNVEHPMICDYANLNRSDFMDMYICATCQLFVGVSGGIVSVPMIFRRPIVYVNHIPLENIHAWDSNAICIPKKIWSHKEGRMLTFREILLSGAGRFMTSQEYQRMELEPVENTSEEIAAAAKEMDDRLKGKWVTSEEDEGLQRKFWGFFKPSEKNRVFVSRIGTEFLRQNQTLLN